MAFDQSTRNRLQRFVTDARELLMKEFTRQLQHEYGLDPASGTVTPITELHIDDSRLETARILRDTLQHYLSSTPDASSEEVLKRIVREESFTVLNRLAALRMAEAREFLIESLSKGYSSRGFQLYTKLAGTALGETGDSYRNYLFSIFDEFALDLKVLFDRFSPSGRLFPRESALLELLNLVNAEDITALWKEDETIGWIYQYFNSKEERKKMRDDSPAPRNSRELAVRNQFFTPRYVVQFLTDNTLGLTWYEMTKGETRLKDHCHYLVRRPNEIFLEAGKDADQSSTSEVNDQQEDSGLSQEELLKRPVLIAHRSRKDPREIRVLDPACGSMHFGLYAFDLLETIYEESWELEEATNNAAESSSEDAAALKTLRQIYSDKQEFLRDVPRLIIEHNLHGIDIDPRAVQIAGLSLWLRAQRAWQQQGVKPAVRPQIRRSNIVCAEPMPGERKLLEEFITQHLSGTPELVLVGQLVRRVFDEMKLAGEAGSLLKIEEEVAGAVGEAKGLWLLGAQTEAEQGALFADLAKHQQQRLGFEVAEITDETFWERAEGGIYAALRTYSAQTENGSGYQRRLFADDAERGFAFIDLCRKRFDVVLMNPPFGDPTESLLPYLERRYSVSKHDLAAAFIDRFLQLSTCHGKLGWISSRTWFSSSLLESFRRDLLYGRHRISLVLDLGIGVLDSALVETAACVASINDVVSTTVRVIRLLASRDKQADSLKKIQNADTMFVEFSRLNALPRAAFGYWFPEDFYNRLSQTLPFEDHLGTAKQGLATTDDFRFLRCLLEVPAAFLGDDKRWVPFAKGGEYEPYFDDLHLVIDWERDGAALKDYLVSQKGQRHWSRRIASAEFYGREGLTYPERTTSDFSPRPLPAGSIFGATGQAVFLQERNQLLAYLGLSYTRIFKQLIELFVGAGDASESGSAARHYTSGILNEMPVPTLDWDDHCDIPALVSELIGIRRQEIRGDETSIEFVSSPISQRGPDLASAIEAARDAYAQSCIRSLEIGKTLENWACGIYGLSSETANEFLEAEVCSFPTDYSLSRRRGSDDLVFSDVSQLVSILCECRGFRRAFTKKGYWANRILELTSHYFQEHPANCTEIDGTGVSRHLKSPAFDLLSYVLGISFGRWDIRFATGQRPAPEFTDPFAALPLCPPGMLQSEEGLPVTGSDVPPNYPVRISWTGILVVDARDHEGVEGRIREVLQVIWQERSESIELELCEILGFETLREYFTEPAGFFAEHLQRYYKSRRQAPIYWPLSTPSGSYTLWLYYHRLNDQTLYSCINNFITPKLDNEIIPTINQLRAKDTQRSRGEEKEFERLQELERELREFRDELLRLTKLPWRPNLNDGVQITAAPLWKLFRLPKWQKALKETWQTLEDEKGEYDWSHLAMTIWPERVVPKCAEDRSLAIAHKVEDLFWVQDLDQWRQLQKPAKEIEEQKRRQQSEPRTRLKTLLASMAEGEDKSLRAESVRGHLSRGDWDDSEVALLLYPSRVAEKAWKDSTLATKLNLKLPNKRTKASLLQFEKTIVNAGCPDLAVQLDSALSGLNETFGTFWSELGLGVHDRLDIALSLWPNRVIEECLLDLNLAERHGVKKFFWCQHPSADWRRREDPETEIANEVARRTTISAK